MCEREKVVCVWVGGWGAGGPGGRGGGYGQSRQMRIKGERNEEVKIAVRQKPINPFLEDIKSECLICFLNFNLQTFHVLNISIKRKQ